MSDWQKRSMYYDKEKNIVHIDAKEEEFVPEFLKYLLEYHGIPEDAKKVFLRDKKGE